MKLYIDFDGTIVNSTKKIVEMLNLKLERDVQYMDVMDYYLSDQFPGLKHKEVLNLFDSPDFFNNLEIFEGFNVSDFTMVTKGTPTNLRLKEEWARNNLGKFTFIGMSGEVKGKLGVPMSDGILIDDFVDNLRFCNAKYKVVFQPYKTKWNVIEPGEDIFVMKSWSQLPIILDCINILEAQEE